MTSCFLIVDTVVALAGLRTKWKENLFVALAYLYFILVTFFKLLYFLILTELESISLSKTLAYETPSKGSLIHKVVEIVQFG